MTIKVNDTSRITMVKIIISSPETVTFITQLLSKNQFFLFF